MQLKPIYNKVFVEVAGVYNNQAIIKGPDGKPIKLFISEEDFTTGSLTDRKVKTGIVRYVCKKLTQERGLHKYAVLEPFPYLIDSFFDPCVYANEIEVKTEDKVYFHTTALSEQSRVEVLENGNEIHQINYHSIFCYVRDNVIHPVEGKALVQQLYEHEVSDVEYQGQVQKMVVSRSGIIVDHNPKTEKRKGVLRYIGKQVGSEHRSDAQIGDLVLLAPNKDFKNVIEGEEFYVTNQNGMFGKEVDGKTIPYGEFLVVKPKYDEPRVGLLLPDFVSLMRESGEVVRKGPLVDPSINIGDIAHYSTVAHSTFFDNMNNEMLVKSPLVYSVGEANVKINKSKPFYSRI